MSNGTFNADIQAQAAREAGRQTARATVLATQRQIEHETALREEREARLKKCIEDFASLDESSLFSFTDKKLAQFQAEHPSESPQYALALNEWNRRLVARQVMATRFSAIVGLVGIVVGSVLGWILASYSFKQSHQQFIDYLSKPQVEEVTSQQPDNNLIGNNPGSVPVDSSVEPSNQTPDRTGAP